ncbi:MAG: hypothetical protein AB3N28_16220 [Kordiimonas sp.]
MKLIKLAPLALLAACGGTTTEPSATQTPVETVVPEPVPAEIAQPAPPPPNAERLRGLNPREVQALMGEPSLGRRDANVQAMLFETNACVFEVIFYEPSDDQHFEATETNARTRRGSDVDRTECLMKILPNSRWLDQQ